MTAAEVLAKHRYAKAACDGCCKAYGYPDRHAAHQIEALRAAGFVVIEMPTVMHKGPYDTDSGFLRMVADRIGIGSGSALAGGNVMRTVAQLLYRAADAAEVS